VGASGIDFLIDYFWFGEDFMKRVTRFFLISVLSCVASYSAAAVGTAVNYPSKPIRFIVPFPPGGPSDAIARLLGQKVNETLGLPVVVDNRPSGAGIVGFDLAAKARPDGYTVLLASGAGLSMNPAVYRKLPYDTVRDFEPITQVAATATLVVINPSVPAKSLQEFVALAKAKPGQLNYATTGTDNLLAAEMLRHVAGIKMEGINYKGSGEALNAILGGEVQLFVINPLVGLPHIKSGKLRAIGMTGPKRNPAFSDVPAVAETYPGYEQIGWHSVVVPAMTPKTIVTKLNTELVRIIKQPDVQERFRSYGVDATGTSPEELADLIKKEIVIYKNLVKQIGYQPQ
jgi:tripartite-type tricarboxylate transporter receptor subunit TctC